MQLTRTHRVLIGLVVAGAVLIAAIGFAGSYAAVRELALSKGFGDFSLVFPIGIDAGICVLLALDLLLTWLRIPFPLLRQTAWLLTAATIAFNGAAAWPDPLGVGMHAVIPVLFVVAVEAARHAVGRIADITADKHMEGVRLTRWLLSPIPTFRLWRRMKLWELRSYEQVIKLEQDRLIYQARLQARYGRSWRRKAPVESLMPLRLAKYGVPLAETGPAGLAAAGIEPALLPPAPAPEPVAAPQAAPAAPAVESAQPHPELPQAAAPQTAPAPEERQEHQEPQEPQEPQEHPQGAEHTAEHIAEQPAGDDNPWFPQQATAKVYEGAYDPDYEVEVPTPHQVPSGAGDRTRPLGNVGTVGSVPPDGPYARGPVPTPVPAPAPVREWTPEDEEFGQIAYEVFSAYVAENNDYPSVAVLDIHLSDGHNVRHPRGEALIRQLMPEFKRRFHAELEADHIAYPARRPAACAPGPRRPRAAASAGAGPCRG